jgi:YebC/PmpR family DNA-binding regulatory protein
MGAQWKQKWRELNADKKGRMVTKMVKEIQVAARIGGPNPEFNARLFAAVEAAKKQSVYRDTIERAIAKGAGLDGEADAFETVTFEGFAPHKIPVMVECLTDNNNRTSAEIKVLFRAGSLGTKGSVAWMFDHIGLVEAWHPVGGTDLETAAIEAEADNVEPLTAETIEDLAATAVAGRFTSSPTSLDVMTKALRSQGWTIVTSELSWQPKDHPGLTDDQREEVSGFLQAIDEHSDVHRVYAAMR